MVQRNQDVDQVVWNVQQNNCVGHYNIASEVEHILVQNGLNVGLHMHNFISLLSKYVRQTELPRGWKVPKFTKFVGDSSESTVGHVARYQTEIGDIDVIPQNLSYFFYIFIWLLTLNSSAYSCHIHSCTIAFLN